MQKKDSVFFLWGGKKKNKKGRRERILEVQVSEVETFCVQVESRKKMTWTFLAKKKGLQDSHSVRICVKFNPPSKHLSFGEKMGLLEVGLATGNSQGPRLNQKSFWIFFRGPQYFFGNSNFWGQLSTNQQKKNTQQTTKKRQAIHLFGDSTEKIAPISSLPRAKPCHAGNPLW